MFMKRVEEMTDNEHSELIYLVVNELLDKCQRSEFDLVGSIRDWHEACSIYCELMFGLVQKCGFRTLKGRVWFFDGRCYVPLEDFVFDRAVEVFLQRIQLSSKNMFHCLSRIQRKARESVRLSPLLRPTYCIQAFENGVVDFRSCDLMPFSPEYDVIYVHPYKFDPRAQCPLWKSFLDDVLEEPESRLILQMFFGLCTYDRGFMGDKVENCLVMYGAGSNGKSTVQEVMRGVLGHENVSSMGLRPLVCGGDEQQRNIGAIDGKLVNMGSELNRNDIRGHEDAFKSLCSGENQYGRSIGKNVYKVENVPWLIFNTNTTLRLEDTSYGVMRRIIWLVFDKTILPQHQNTHLATDLVREYPGIMNWIISGGKKLKRLCAKAVRASASIRSVMNMAIVRR